MFYHIDSLMPCCKDSVKFLELSFVRVGKSYSQCYIIELDRLEKNIFDVISLISSQFMKKEAIILLK